MALQEIGPRFTLKMRSLRKGLPAVKNLGEAPKNLEFDTFETEETDKKEEPVALSEEAAPGVNEDEDVQMTEEQPAKKTLPPKTDEFMWMWKVRITLDVFFEHLADGICSRNWRLREERSFCSARMTFFAILFRQWCSIQRNHSCVFVNPLNNPGFKFMPPSSCTIILVRKTI